MPVLLCEFQTVKAFLPSMLANNHGHIVSINSLLGLMGAGGATEYCASKFGALGLYEALSVEIAREQKNGVFLTTVHPYQVDTSMFAGAKTRCVTLIFFAALIIIIIICFQNISTDGTAPVQKRCSQRW